MELLRELLNKSDKNSNILELTEIKFGEFSPEVVALFEDFKHVQMLVISNCDLKTL